MNVKAITLVVILACISTCAFGDSSLSDAYSGAIGQSYADGSFQALYLQWFGAAARPNPPCLKYYPEVVLRRSALDKVLDSGVVRVGLGLLNAPYSFVDNGVLKGFDIDLAGLLTAKVAAKYNTALTVEFTLVDNFNVELPLGIQNDDFDLIVSDFSITAARQQDIDFTCAYYPAEVRILRSGLEPERVFTSIAELNNPTVTFALFSGTLLEGLTRNFFPNANYLSIVDPTKATALSDVLVAMENQEAHVTVLPEGLITYFLANPNNCTGCSLLDLPFVPPLYKGIGTQKAFPCPGNSGHGNGNGNNGNGHGNGNGNGRGNRDHKRVAFN